MKFGCTEEHSNHHAPGNTICFNLDDYFSWFGHHAKPHLNKKPYQSPEKQFQSLNKFHNL